MAQVQGRYEYEIPKLYPKQLEFCRSEATFTLYGKTKGDYV